MTVDMLERAASALGPLLEEVVFVGGATITLWITDPGAPAPRPTDDVDVVVEVASRAALYDFEQRMRDRGFREDVYGGVICRWRYGDRGRAEDLILDAMPAEAHLMGFANRWQGDALPHAAQRRLPSGITIRAVTPPYLVASKLEAFNGRGRGDHLASRDLEDIILLVDGRDELLAELADAPDDVRSYVAAQLADRLAEPRFVDAVYGFLRPDAASQARAERFVLPRLRALAGQ
jgi:predicted nucleotidyltransferase